MKNPRLVALTNPPTQTPFKLKVDKLVLNKTVFADATLKFQYAANFDLHINFETDQKYGAKLALENSAENFFQIEGLKAPLLQTAVQFSSKETTCVDLVAKYSPSVLYTNRNPNRISLFVLNGPELYFQDYELKVEIDGFKLAFTELDDAKKIRQASKYKNDPLLTGQIKVSQVDGSTFEYEDGYRAAIKLTEFLTFARGRTVTVGHIIGWDADDVVLFAGGFNQSGSPKNQRNWFGLGQVGEVDEIAKLFLLCLSSVEKGEVLLRSTEFYRTSSEIRENSIEMAIVASNAALEVLVPFILEKYANFDGNLLSERIAFHSKLRSCFGVIGFRGDIFSGLENLRTKAKKLNNADAFELSTLFRNRIVHQGKQFDMTGLELIEIWNFQMWMIEILVLFVIGYGGTMNDRRPISGWANTGSKVPYRL